VYWGRIGGMSFMLMRVIWIDKRQVTVLLP
jgi:hypothetical protein